MVNLTSRALIDIALHLVYRVRQCPNVVMEFSTGTSQEVVSLAGSGLYGTLSFRDENLN